MATTNNRGRTQPSVSMFDQSGLVEEVAADVSQLDILNAALAAEVCLFARLPTASALGYAHFYPQNQNLQRGTLVEILTSYTNPPSRK
jgi:hypothetical protein